MKSFPSPIARMLVILCFAGCSINEVATDADAGTSGAGGTAGQTQTGGASGDSGSGGTAGSGSSERLLPEHLTYQGAFRLPDEFSWGARGASFSPSGTLLVTGPELLIGDGGEPCSYDGVSGCQAYYGEVTVPAPVPSADWEALPAAALTRPLTAFDGGLVRNMHPSHSFVNTFVSGIEYVPRRGSQSTDKIYGSVDAWYTEGDFGNASFPTVWFSNLDGSSAQGLFHVGPSTDALFHGRKSGTYLFSIPQWYADQHLGGRTLMTGKSRGTATDMAPGLDGDGAVEGGSQGPTLLAFAPRDTDSASGDLDARAILYYRVKYDACAAPDVGVSGETLSCDFPGFSMCDTWTGGGFLESGNRTAVVLLGWKGSTNCYYCGDPEDDSECHVPQSEWAQDCSVQCNESRGYHCGPYERQVIFYDTSELGASAAGTRDPWSVLPYHTWRPTEFFLQGNTCFDVGGMAVDREGGRLFMIEKGLGSDNAAVVHVWKM